MRWLAWEQIREGLYQLSGSMLGVAGLRVAAIADRATRSCDRSRGAARAGAGARGRGRAALVRLLQRPSVARPLQPAAGRSPRARSCGAGVGLLPRRLAAACRRRCSSPASRADQSPLDLQAPHGARSAARRRESRRPPRRHRTTSSQHYDGAHHHDEHGLARALHARPVGGWIRLRDFLHEGNGELWVFAMRPGPARFAGWMAIEEQAEGGDALYQRPSSSLISPGIRARRGGRGGGALPSALTRALGSGFQVPGSRLVQGSGFQVQCSGFRVPSARFRFQVGSGFGVPGALFRVPGARFRIPGAKCPVPNASSGFSEAGCWSEEPGSRNLRTNQTLNPEPPTGTWNHQPGTWNPEPTWNLEPGTLEP